MQSIECNQQVDVFVFATLRKLVKPGKMHITRVVHRHGLSLNANERMYFVINTLQLTFATTGLISKTVNIEILIAISLKLV